MTFQYNFFCFLSANYFFALSPVINLVCVFTHIKPKENRRKTFKFVLEILNWILFFLINKKQKSRMTMMVVAFERKINFKLTRNREEIVSTSFASLSALGCVNVSTRRQRKYFACPTNEEKKSVNFNLLSLSKKTLLLNWNFKTWWSARRT